jgi:hypothetical protein
MPYGIPFGLHMTAVHTVSNNIHIGGIVQMLYINRYIGWWKNCGLFKSDDWILCQCVAWGCASVQHLLKWIRWILQHCTVYT